MFPQLDKDEKGFCQMDINQATFAGHPPHLLCRQLEPSEHDMLPRPLNSPAVLISRVSPHLNHDDRFLKGFPHISRSPSGINPFWLRLAAVCLLVSLPPSLI